MKKQNILLIIFMTGFFSAGAGERPEAPFRVLYNNDLTHIRTCESPYHKADQEFNIEMLKASVDETVKAGFDAHMLAPLLTYVPAWKSKIYPIEEHVEWLKSRFPNIKISDYIKCLADGTDIVGVFVEHCRTKGIAPFITVRMNDWHTLEWIGADSDTQLDFFIPNGLDKWRWMHPEYRVSDPTEWAAVEKGLTDDRKADLRKPNVAQKLREQRVMDWRFEPVRERMLGFIEEICRGYDIAGLELDFMRHMQIFNLEKTTAFEREKIMTEFLTRVRALLDETAKPGQYRYLSMRVPAYSCTYNAYGFNLENLYQTGVDMLTLSCNYYTVQQIDTARIHQIAPKLKLYPELTYTMMVGKAETKNGTVSTYRKCNPEDFWTAAHIAYSLGASGVSFFNFPYYRQWGGNREDWCEPPFYAISVLKDPKILAEKPQHYFLCGGWASFLGYAKATDQRLLSLMPSVWTEGRTRIFKPDMFLPAGGWKNAGRLRLQSVDVFGDRKVNIWVNGSRLTPSDNISEPYKVLSPALLGNETNLRAWIIPDKILRSGENEIKVELQSGSPLTVSFMDISI